MHYSAILYSKILNNQAIGIGYRLYLVTLAAEKADVFFPPRTALDSSFV